MKILALSDKIVSFIYSPLVKKRFPDSDLIIGCGDLAYYYLEYVFTALEVPLFYVRGNHDSVVEFGTGEQRTEPHGGIDLHGRLSCYRGLLLGGVEGSVRYRLGPFQHSQAEMWNIVFKLVPGMMINHLRYGRYLDVFVSHAPPSGIHDCEDLTHQGIKAFRWLISVFKPGYFLHGHIHLHRPDEVIETQLGATRIINTYGFRQVDVSTGQGAQVPCK